MKTSILYWTIQKLLPSWKNSVINNDDCKAYLTFLKDEFYKDKKGVIRVKKIPCTFYSKDSIQYDSLISKPLSEIQRRNRHCTLKITDIFNLWGKPNFIGQTSNKSWYCVYFVVADFKNCPKGQLSKVGPYSYEYKEGYVLADYCHSFIFYYRKESKEIASIDSF